MLNDGNNGNNFSIIGNYLIIGNITGNITGNYQ